MKYVSLHHHSTYSYMDGYGLPAHHVQRAADLGMSAMALTEHGNVSSHVKLEQAATKAGIKPLFGLEGYMAAETMREDKNTRKWHQTILAMDQTGLSNLYSAVTRSWDEGFYMYPTITPSILRDHHEGLIILSGCLDSKLACDLLGGKGRPTGDLRDAERTLLQFKRVLGDRFYLETQQFPELSRAHQLNTKYEEWSKKYDIPLVATSDCHYPMPDHNEYQKILHAAGRNIGTVAAAEASWEYNIRLTLPTSDKMIIDRLISTGLTRAGAEQAVANTALIADRCNVVLPKMERIRYPVPNDMKSSEVLLRKWLNEGWTYRGFHQSLTREQRREYKERVEYEMGLIVEKDFVDYFLMTADVIRYCKENGCPVGPARGSAAASLVCYLLRITEVNPMAYPLMLFERFIDPNRHDLPDIDTDFDDDNRDMARQYLARKYGEDRVGNIGTFTRYRGKNAIDDVARVYALPKAPIERAKEFLVERSGGDTRFDASIQDTVDMFPQVKEVFQEFPDLYKAVDLEGNYKGFGVHAAGVVLGAEALSNYVAMYSKSGVGKNKNTLKVLSVDKYDGEYLGLLKGDFLGLTTMGMIRIMLELTGISLDDLYRLPMDDPETMAAFNRADVTGIFQFEGRTMRMVTEELKPTTFMDLSAINALSRPGPLHSGSTGDYIAIRHGRMEREHLHPLVTKLTETTEGQIIYQEQILQICREIGKFPWVSASAIRKIISQKKGEAAFNTLSADFMKGAAENGIDQRMADIIWRKMVTAGAYAFNIAHCVSYSVLGVWLMWMKVHHPIAFYTAALRKCGRDEKGRDKQLKLMRDMQDERFGRNLKVLPPDLNRSGITWTPVEGGVAAGFSQIPGIGEKVSAAIIEHRELVGGFGSWDELLSVKGIGKGTLAKIIDFATKDDPFGVNWISDNVEAIKDAIRSGDLAGVPMPDTKANQVPYEARRSEHIICGTVKARNLQDMFENHRSRTGVELDPATVKDPDLKDSMTMYMEDETGLMTVKVDRWLYPKLKDELWDIKLGHHFVVARCTKSAFYGKTIKVKKLWVIEP